MSEVKPESPPAETVPASAPVAGVPTPPRRARSAVARAPSRHVTATGRRTVGA